MCIRDRSTYPSDSAYSPVSAISKSSSIGSKSSYFLTSESATTSSSSSSKNAKLFSTISSSSHFWSIEGASLFI